RPDLVLSGVNRGQNLGEDVSMSGTVAGALQGMALGIPSLALSQCLLTYRPDYTGSFAVAEAFAPGLVAHLLAAGWRAGVVLNLNFPDRPPAEVTEVAVTAQGFRDRVHMNAEKRTDRRGRDYYWMGFSSRTHGLVPGTDLAAIAEGKISITPLHIDLTHMA